MSPIDIGRDEAQRRAVQEMLDESYQREPLAERVLRTFQQFVGDLLDSAPGGVIGGVLAAIVILMIVLAIAGLLLWYGRKATAGGVAITEGIFGGRVLTAAEHRAEAERLAEAGDFAGAVRERMRAIARGLEERALIDRQPGRTADELAAAAGHALPDFAADLGAAAQAFDDIAYGEVPGTRAHYDTLRTLDERLRTARRRQEASR
ncbi:DUF4129 domain-containing protein [Streptosporangium sp. KLBMP 9127]|nr:DUF4129 domain-containing protein [Streptosporangium sp. KLBMP 9127]